MKKILSLLTVIAAMFTGNANAQNAADAAPAAEKVEASAAEATKAPEEAKKEEAPAGDAATSAATGAENPAAATDTPVAATNDLANTLIMTLKDGVVIIKLRPDLAPVHVARILDLTKQGFYDNVVFHRVIDGFMAQTGDPTGTGRGGSGQKLNAEFSAEKHTRGVLSMARAADPNSADSQFFIMFADAPHLDNNYTIFGEVVSGMEFVDKVKKGTGPNGMVTDPDKIVSLKVASDVPVEELPELLKAAASTAPVTESGEAVPTAAPVTGDESGGGSVAPAETAPAAAEAPATTEAEKPAQ